MKISQTESCIKILANCKKIRAKNNLQNKRFENIYSHACISFYGTARKPKISDCTTRQEELKDAGISEEYIEKFTNYRQSRYDKVRELIKTNCYVECIPKLTKLPKHEFVRAKELVNHNIVDENIYSLIDLNEKKYRRIINLKDKGVDTNDLEIYSKLPESVMTKALALMKEGYAPVDAAYLSRLNKKNQRTAKMLIERGVSAKIAYNITIAGEDTINHFIKMTDEGTSAEDATDYIALDEQHKKDTNSFVSEGISIDVAYDMSCLNKEMQKKALEYFKEGVYPDYIPAIILAEKKGDKLYQLYRDRGYGRTVSYLLSAFDGNEIDTLEEIIKSNPKIKDLLGQEYDITLVNMQDLDIPAAIFTKVQPLKNKTVIKHVKTFDAEGNSTSCRIEQHLDRTTSAILENGSDVLKMEYDKKGNVKSITQYIQNPETKGVEGVLYSKFSNLIPGVLESVYYDVNDFKTASYEDDDYKDKTVEESVLSKGIPVSSVFVDKNGFNVFEEDFEFMGFSTQREYKEKKDKKGNIIESYYRYDITDENDKKIMNIEREMIKTDRNTAVHKINGITYNLSFDDKKKSVTIEDGTNTRILDFKNKLAYYSSDYLWEVIKNLPTDNLITIYENTDYWNYCRDEDSAADGYTNTLSTGTDLTVIAHEAGHFKDYEVDFISNNEDFKKNYSREMYNFSKIMPYTGYEILNYLSPYADLFDALGPNEFVAETNCILSNYGTNNEKYRLRSQFLVKYFPETIAKTAELLGKTSKKSLLDE